MLALALGLMSAASWGAADFIGGLASRRAAALAIVALSQAAGLAFALALLAALRPEAPGPGQIALGMLAGASGVVGLASLYRAMAVGSMSIVAPISALGALVPLAVDLAAGRSPGALALAGMVVALAGAGLAARAPGPASRRGVGLALLAALGFGGFFVLLGEAANESPLWALASARFATFPVALVAAIALGAGVRRVRGGLLGLVLLAGVLDAAANLFFAAGTREGLVSVAAVLASLYPAVTVALAAGLLSERMSAAQAAGGGVALAGVVMIAAG